MLLAAREPHSFPSELPRTDQQPGLEVRSLQTPEMYPIAACAKSTMLVFKSTTATAIITKDAQPNHRKTDPANHMNNASRCVLLFLSIDSSCCAAPRPHHRRSARFSQPLPPRRGLAPPCRSTRLCRNMPPRDHKQVSPTLQRHVCAAEKREERHINDYFPKQANDRRASLHVTTEVCTAAYAYSQLIKATVPVLGDLLKRSGAPRLLGRGCLCSQ